eukprot:351138-Chlamydomonas_euryale.AAC.10
MPVRRGTMLSQTAAASSRRHTRAGVAAAGGNSRMLANCTSAVRADGWWCWRFAFGAFFCVRALRDAHSSGGLSWGRAERGLGTKARAHHAVLAEEP